MSTIIVGERDAAERFAATFADAEKPRIWAAQPPPAGEPEGSSGPLARALAGFEAEAIGQEPDLVIAADASDAALAAILVATKLLIAAAASEDARAPASANGRLIAQLAGAYTRPA